MKADAAAFIEQSEAPVLLYDRRAKLVSVSTGFETLAAAHGDVQSVLDAMSVDLVPIVRAVARGQIADRREVAGKWSVLGFPCGDHAVVLVQEDAGARLRENESFVHSLFEHSTVGLNLCRMDGLWIESNQAFLDIIGYTADEADGGLTYWELTPREYDEAEKAQLASLSSRGCYGPFEKEFIRKDGSRVPVRLNGFVVERDGEKFIWSVIEDITNERALAAEVEFERHLALQAARLSSLGEMAAGLAHEVNNPLAIIESLAYELEHIIASGNTDGMSQAVASIRESAQRAGRVVRGLGMFSRRQVDDVQLHPVRQLVEDSLVLVRPREKYEGVAIEVEYASDAVIRTSKTEMGQVLVNLVNNAIDAVQEGSERWVRLRVEEDGEAVAISVEDPGPGVAPANVPHLFTPFFTTKGPGDGTGLGLSISKGIVERKGGSLVYERVADLSRFTVRLPISSRGPS